jgi:hypothetical protein
MVDTGDFGEDGHPCSSSELGGDIAADRAKTDGWLSERQAELAASGVRFQTFQEPLFAGLPHFTQAGEPGFMANELLRAFQPHHEFFQPTGVFLRDFHEHLSIACQYPDRTCPPQVRTEDPIPLLQWSLASSRLQVIDEKE